MQQPLKLSEFKQAMIKEYNKVNQLIFQVNKIVILAKQRRLKKVIGTVIHLEKKSDEYRSGKMISFLMRAGQPLDHRI
ncbi:hypothetical protein [Bacillus gobiensis]|uniref:hypothetical protein n=1 Tax=Bacillus gobiensis TaxID=1441095 RepID=UPI003D235D08